MNFNSIFKSINISNIAKSVSSTLNVVKKVIPVYKEVKPYISKEKSIFKEVQTKESNIEPSTLREEEINDSLTFFN